MNVTVVVVPADEEQPPVVKELENYDYRSGQAIVGGLIQVLDVDRVGASIFCNEEGLVLQLPFNRRATEYLYKHAPEHRGFNVLVGDVYITGVPDESGDTTSVPANVIAEWTG